MSWSKSFAAVAACVALAGCGFQPLYGDGGSSDKLSPQLASIRVTQIAEHYGQAMTNDLHDGLNPHALQVPAVYNLDVALREGTVQIAIRADGTPSRQALQFTATWLLRRISDHQIVAKGSVKSSAGYDVLDNDYGNVVSASTGELRAVHDLSDQIQLTLADILQAQPKT
jgi:LPS-assembly lipoprotein